MIRCSPVHLAFFGGRSEDEEDFCFLLGHTVLTQIQQSILEPGFKVRYAVILSIFFKHTCSIYLITCILGVSLPVWVKCNQSILSMLTQSSIALVIFHHPEKHRREPETALKRAPSPQRAPSSLIFFPPDLLAPCLGWCVTGGPGERAFFFSAFLAISLCFSSDNRRHFC